MKKLLPLLAFCMFYSMIAFNANGQSVAVTKTNPTKVYIHYMPWFTAPENPDSGVSYAYGVTGVYNEWGAHWSAVNSNSANPNTFATVTNYAGTSVQTRNICAHYHPLIGPYDGQDSVVLQYHLLLMKLSGIDGVLIDWYGQGGEGAADAAPLLVNSNALIGRVGSAGLKYGLIMEDAAWDGMSGAESNGNYAVSNYFTDPNYIKLGDMRGASATNATSPVVGVFGPQQFLTSADWATILSGNTGAFLTLYGQSGPIQPAAAGEFVWPYPQAGQSGTPPAWYTNNSNYYANQASAINIVLGTAYAGFNDFYGANGTDEDGIIPRNYGTDGNTLSTMLSLYNQNKSVLDGIQLVTWNDFSEGTILEPTVEYGFASLDTIQKFTGVPYTEADLQQVYRFFTLRKEYFGNTTKQLQLNRVYNYFTALQISAASALMDTIQGITSSVPVISSATTATGTLGTAFTYTITASNTPTSYAATGLPTGLSINTTTGIISGTPTIAATSNIAISATNASGTGTATLVLTIDPLTPVITSGKTASAIVGNSLSYVITASNSPTTYSATSLPAGLVLNPYTGVISGTLTTAGTSNVTIGATNAGGTATATLTITVSAATSCSGAIALATSTPPALTGTIDTVWAKVAPTAITKVVNGVTQPDYSAQWRAMYDNNNLYVLVEVKDTILEAPPYGPNLYDDDAVEIYIDANNTKTTSYGSTDHQFGFDWGVTPTTANMYGSTPNTGIVYAIPSVTGGYNLAAAIPWSTIGGTAPANGKLIGFDININDNDGSAAKTRQATNSWYSTSNQNFTNPSLFGTVALTVCNATLAPVINSSSTTSGTIGTTFSYTITASNTPTSYAATNLPAGLSVNASTGVISGIPTTPGTSNVTISATNSGGTGTATLAITVNPAKPVVTSSTTATGTVGTAFNYTITGSNSPTSYAATNLPAGLSLNTSTGVISGTPTASGTSNVTISATNVTGTGTAALTITISNSTPSAPVISSSITATGTVGSAFTYTIAASNSPTSYAATGLPTGLSVNTSTGLINGTPTTAGTSSVTISATNTGGTGKATLTITINPAKPTITSATTATGTLGTAFTYTITASNTPTSYAATGLPTGLSINTTTGIISGTPTIAATSNIAISATNASGTGTATLVLTIDPLTPVITSGKTASAIVGNSLSYVITASNSPTTYSATSLPAGLVLNPYTGVISGTLTTAGTSNVTIGATNAGGTATATLTITVSAATSCSGAIALATSTPPALTGTIDTVWAKVAPTAITKVVNGVTQPDYSAQWRAMYDNNNLYVLVEVKDTILEAPPYGPNLYDDDAVEIYIDANNTKTTSYGSTDHQFGFDWGVTPTTANMYGSTPNTGIVYAIPSVTGGYNLAAAIPWSTIGGTAPANGKLIGFDININDNDGSAAKTRQATNSWYSTSNQNFTNPSLFGTVALTVCNATLAPVINSAATVAGTVGTTFSYTITASNTPTGYGATGLPAGLSINSTTGIISGVPTTAGTYTANISATNTAGTGTQALTITINLSAPIISSGTSATGTEGKSFSYSITASNSPTSYAATNLPAGLSINTSTGMISGSPTASGTFSVTISAINAGGTGTATLTITIAPAAPVITSSAAASGSVGTAFTYSIIASNSPTSYAATGLPAGLSINATTGIISGTPTTVATTTVTISATNAGGTGTLPLVITISTQTTQNSLSKKLMMGYQGWFNAAGDGSPIGGWAHWFHSGNNPSGSNLNVDVWPDMTEYPKQYATSMAYNNGSVAKLFSAYDQSTVNVHFKWMQNYNIYGVYLQRFLGEVINNPPYFANRNQVLQNVKNASKTYARHYSVMYDITGVPNSEIYTDLISDWQYLVNTYNLNTDSQYVQQNGVPVIAIWGIGFSGRGLLPQSFDSLISYFHSNSTPAKYRAYVVGGLPSHWRILSGDSETDTAWTTVYHSLDMISPWTVGRYGDSTDIVNWKNQVIVPDMADCAAHNIAYMPVIWPGGSNYNENFDTVASDLNSPPRNGGKFYWQQAYDAISAGANYLYVAMFDEVDEGTAMFKGAPTKAYLPAQGTLVPYNVDGYNLPSDWYLQLANQSQLMLNNNIVLTDTIPITPIIPAPVVYLSSTTPANAGITSGSFTIAASNLTKTITVGYTIGGNAPAADYTASPALSGSVTLTPTSPIVAINISPVTTGLTNANEAVQLSLNTGTGYTIGSDTASVSFIASTPYTGTAAPIPGEILAVNYNLGGQGVGYYNSADTNSGGQYRPTDGVGIEACSEGGYDIGWITTGEWFAYTVKVNSAGVYTLQARVASPNTGGVLHVELNDVNISGPIRVPNTTGWETWQTVTVTTPALATGQNLLQVVVDTSGFNFEYLNFILASSPTTPVISSTLTTSGTAGTTFSYTITASNTPTSYAATGLPAGLSINTSTGVISGTPTTAGTSNVTISATNASGTGTATLVITISAFTTPVISSAGTARGNVGTAFSYSITASNSPTSYGATGLPSGLSVNTSTGIISGTPTATGTFSATVTATNAGGTASKVVTITIAAAVPAIAGSGSIISELAGTAFSYYIIASNSPTSYGATGLPTGLSLNTSTGIISGSATTAGTYPVVLNATNASGTGSLTISMIIYTATTDAAGTITCYKSPSTITVDGHLTETGWNVTRPLNKIVLGTYNNTGTFGVLWDNTNLYIGAKILDANLFSTSSTSLWNDDAVEIFLDPNYNRSTTYEGDDNQIIEAYNQSGVTTQLAISSLQHAWAAIPGGYSVEIAIPWSQLGITSPAAGLNIGFDIGNDDDDTGGGREGQAVWNGTINDYENTSAFGTLTLNASTSTITSSKPEIEITSIEPVNTEVILMPNPVTNGSFKVLLPQWQGSVQTEIRGFDGRLLKTGTSNVGIDSKINVDASNLSTGAYIIQLKNNGMIVSKKFLIE